MTLYNVQSYEFSYFDHSRREESKVEKSKGTGTCWPVASEKIYLHDTI